VSQDENQDSDRLVILRFSSQSEIREFFSYMKESGLGSIVKVSDDSDYEEEKSKEKKSTLFSELGLEKLDQKRTEKPNLV